MDNKPVEQDEPKRGRGKQIQQERRRRKLVRRSHFMTIIAAWVITVPAAALLSGVIFLALNGVFG